VRWRAQSGLIRSLIAATVHRLTPAKARTSIKKLVDNNAQ
jgi:hypothetical protein